MSESWRPPFCPDPTGCTPLIHPLTDSDNMTLDQRGFAVFCFGRLSEPLTWTFDGIEHVETLSTCQSSPLKGVVRWLENEADWSALLRSYRAAIAAAARQPEGQSDLGSEYGRLLAERDRLIASGVDPADLEAPLRPDDAAQERSGE